jgi:hypothetical protein
MGAFAPGCVIKKMTLNISVGQLNRIHFFVQQSTDASSLESNSNIYVLLEKYKIGL